MKTQQSPVEQMTIQEYLAERQHFVDAELDRLLPPETIPPETIHKAMRYSVFAGGKRIRPVLALATALAPAAPLSSGSTCTSSPLRAKTPLAMP